jgi:hypothetical protein
MREGSDLAVVALRFISAPGQARLAQDDWIKSRFTPRHKPVVLSLSKDSFAQKVPFLVPKLYLGTRERQPTSPYPSPSVISSLSRDQFGRSSGAEAELISRPARDDRSGSSFLVPKYNLGTRESQVNQGFWAKLWKDRFSRFARRATELIPRSDRDDRGESGLLQNKGRPGCGDGQTGPVGISMAA